VLSWRRVDILVDDFGNCAFGALLFFACLLILLPPMLVTGEERFEEEVRGPPDDANGRLSEFVCNGFLASFVLLPVKLLDRVLLCKRGGFLLAGWSTDSRDHDPLNDAAAEESAPFFAFGGGDGFCGSGVVASAEGSEEFKSADSFERGLEVGDFELRKVSKGVEGIEGALVPEEFESSDAFAISGKGVKVVVVVGSSKD